MKLLSPMFVGVMMMSSAACLITAHTAYSRHRHHSEILRVDRELRAECIAILLRNRPRKQWMPLAIEWRDDPSICKQAMDFEPHDLPMKGDNWLDRLDVGREVMEPTQ